MPRTRDAVTRGQLASVVGKGLRAPAHVPRIANIVPTAVRSLPGLVGTYRSGCAKGWD